MRLEGRKNTTAPFVANPSQPVFGPHSRSEKGKTGLVSWQSPKRVKTHLRLKIDYSQKRGAGEVSFFRLREGKYECAIVLWTFSLASIDF